MINDNLPMSTEEYVAQKRDYDEFLNAYHEARIELGLPESRAYVPASAMSMTGLILNELWWAGWIERDETKRQYRPRVGG